MVGGCGGQACDGSSMECVVAVVWVEVVGVGGSGSGNDIGGGECVRHHNSALS
jgi:hypothetical protein